MVGGVCFVVWGLRDSTGCGGSPRALPCRGDSKAGDWWPLDFIHEQSKGGSGVVVTAVVFVSSPFWTRVILGFIALVAMGFIVRHMQSSWKVFKRHERFRTVTARVLSSTPWYPRPACFIAVVWDPTRNWRIHMFGPLISSENEPYSEDCIKIENLPVDKLDYAISTLPFQSQPSCSLTVW